MTNDDITPRQALMREAALWLAQMDSGTADVAAFEAWRDADPRRAAAVARLLGATAQLDRVRPLIGPGAADGRTRAGLDRRRWMFGIGGMAATALLALGTVAVFRGGRVYAATRVGDRQILSLPGGAQLDLNTDTKVSYHFDDHVRKVWLERGEIALTVPAGGRPCEILSGEQRATITSGKVNARKTSQGFLLLVQTGACALSASDGARAMAVRADEIASVSGESVVVHAAPEPERQFATGWQNDDLMLDGQTLAQAVEEFNRYQISKIVIADPLLAGVRLGGRFSLHDPSDFLASLRSGFGIVATKTPAGDITLGRPS